MIPLSKETPRMADTNQMIPPTIMPITRNVSMNTFEEDLVIRFQREERLRSFAAAWSRILIEWARLTGRLPPEETSGSDNN